MPAEAHVSAEHERQVLDEAIKQQERVVLQARLAAGREIYADNEPEHRKLLAAVIHAVEQLAQAFKAERQFCHKLSQQGVDHPPTGVKFASAAQLPRALKTMRCDRFVKDNRALYDSKNKKGS